MRENVPVGLGGAGELHQIGYVLRALPQQHGAHGLGQGNGGGGPVQPGHIFPGKDEGLLRTGGLGGARLPDPGLAGGQQDQHAQQQERQTFDLPAHHTHSFLMVSPLYTPKIKNALRNGFNPPANR